MVILKIDVDVKMSKQLLREFMETRRVILSYLGYNVRSIVAQETEHGYHFWIDIEDHEELYVDQKRKAELQFLLGDDQRRARYNFLRGELGAFGTFNALFSEKIKEKVSLWKVIKIWLKVKLKLLLNSVIGKLRKW